MAARDRDGQDFALARRKPRQDEADRPGAAAPHLARHEAEHRVLVQQTFELVLAPGPREVLAMDGGDGGQVGR